MERLSAATILSAVFVLCGALVLSLSYAARVSAAVPVPGGSTITAQELEALKCRGTDVSRLSGSMFTALDKATLGIPANPTTDNDWCLFLQARKNPKGGIKDYGSCASARAWRAKNAAQGTEWAEIRVNFDPKFGQCLMDFIKFLEDEKGFRPLINSGVRNAQEQDEIWERSCGGSAFAASRPGARSSHNIGLAADLQLPDPPNQDARSRLAHESGLALDFNVPNDRPHVQATGAGCSSGGIVPSGRSSLTDGPGTTNPTQGLLTNLANWLKPKPAPQFPPMALPTAPTQIVGSAYTIPSTPAAAPAPVTTSVTTSVPVAAPKTSEEQIKEITVGTKKAPEKAAPARALASSTVVYLAEERVALKPPAQILVEQAQAKSAPTAGGESIVGFLSDPSVPKEQPPSTFIHAYQAALERIRLALLELLRLLGARVTPVESPRAIYAPSE